MFIDEILDIFEFTDREKQNLPLLAEELDENYSKATAKIYDSICLNAFGIKRDQNRFTKMAFSGVILDYYKAFIQILYTNE